MTRKVEFINSSSESWQLCCFGGLIVPAEGSLDVTSLISDPELIKSIQIGGLGNEFDVDHHLKINNVNFTATQSKNYMAFEQDGGVAKFVP